MENHAGYYPIKKDGRMLAAVYIYKSEEQQCYKRAMVILKLLGVLENEVVSDRTGGPAAFQAMLKEIAGVNEVLTLPELPAPVELEKPFLEGPPC